LIVCCFHVVCGVPHVRVGKRSYIFHINQKYFLTLASRAGDGFTLGQILSDQNLITILYKTAWGKWKNFELKP